MQIERTLINQASDALLSYLSSIGRATGSQEIDDYKTLHAIGIKLIEAVTTQDWVQTKLLLAGFSRQVSDSYSAQPPEYRTLAEAIDKIRKIVLADK